MKNILLSQNMNSWISQSDLSLTEKIDLFSDYLKKKYPNFAEVVVINLQEVIGGRGGIYLSALQKEFPGYDIITPISFNHLQHYKSLMNVTLIRAGLGYMPIRFDSCLPNRMVERHSDSNPHHECLFSPNCYVFTRSRTVVCFL